LFCLREGENEYLLLMRKRRKRSYQLQLRKKNNIPILLGRNEKLSVKPKEILLLSKTII
jgi:hypothetical protein